MVDTFGIPRVVDARGTTFGRQQFQRTPQPFVKPLTCAGRGCSAAAVAVVGHLRLQTWVEPMYRLGPGADHSAGCPFNVDRRVDDLVHAHRAAVEPRDGQYRLLLQIAKERPNAARVRTDTKDIPAPGPPPSSSPHLTRTLPPVIKAAAAVVRLHQDLDDDPVAKAQFVAVNHTPTDREQLSWDEFLLALDEVARVSSGHQSEPWPTTRGVGSRRKSRLGEDGTHRVHPVGSR